MWMVVKQSGCWLLQHAIGGEQYRMMGKGALCLVQKFLSPNFTIHLLYQISYLMHGALNVDK